MKKQKFKEIGKNLVVIIIITIVLISILALIYSFTQSRIKENETVYKKRAILFASAIAIPSSYSDLINLYKDSIEELGEKDGVEIFKFINKQKDSADILSKGYVLIFSGPGLWGEITLALAFGKDLETIAGIEFISQNETPGLGGRIQEKWFKEQFRGKKNIIKLVSEKEKPKEDEISSITGATNTTKYVLNLIELGKEYIKRLNLEKIE